MTRRIGYKYKRSRPPWLDQWCAKPQEGDRLMTTLIRQTCSDTSPQWPGTWRVEDPQQWATLNARPLLVLDHPVTSRTRCHHLYLPREEYRLVETNLCALLAAVRRAGYATAAVAHERLSEDGVPDDLIHLPKLK